LVEIGNMSWNALLPWGIGPRVSSNCILLLVMHFLLSSEMACTAQCQKWICFSHIRSCMIFFLRLARYKSVYCHYIRSSGGGVFDHVFIYSLLPSLYATLDYNSTVLATKANHPSSSTSKITPQPATWTSHTSPFNVNQTLLNVFHFNQDSMMLQHIHT